MSASWSDVPFEELLLDTKDGEWGGASPGVGLREVLIIRGTDFKDVNNPSAEFPRRWVKDHLVERKQLTAGDIILETAGGTSSQSTGRSVLLKPSFFQQHPHLPVLCASFSRHLRIKQEKYDSHFISYLLQGLYRFGYMGVFNIQHTGVSRFQFTDFKNHTKLEIPKKPTQRKIAAVLAAYDDLIEANRRRIALLERMAEEIYREWFVRLRFPGHEKNKITKGIPAGWEIRPFSDVVTINPTERIDKEEDRPFVAMEELSTSSMYFTAKERRNGHVGPKFRNGDVIFPRITPSVENGKRGLVMTLADGEVAQGSTEFIVMREKVITSEHIYFLSCSEGFRTNAELSMTGASGRQRVQEQCFDNFLVKTPPPALREKFTAVVRPMVTQIRLLSQQSDALQRTRDLLLPRLISGKLPVEARDIAFPPSMAEARAGA